jgi:hypothetical protein
VLQIDSASFSQTESPPIPNTIADRLADTLTGERCVPKNGKSTLTPYPGSDITSP